MSTELQSRVREWIADQVRNDIFTAGEIYSMR